MSFIDKLINAFNTFMNFISKLFTSFIDFLIIPFKLLYYLLEGVIYFISKLFLLIIEVISFFIALFQFLIAIVTGLLRTAKKWLTFDISQTDSINFVSESGLGFQTVFSLLGDLGFTKTVPMVLTAFAWFFFATKIVGLYKRG